MSEVDQPLLDIGEVCRWLNVSRPTIYRWRKQGKGPQAIKAAGGHLKWRTSEVKRWLDEQEKASE